MGEPVSSEIPQQAETKMLPRAEDGAAEPVPWELSVQLLGLMVVVLLLGLVAAPANDPLLAFREGRLSDHASAILLAMAGALAFAAFLLQAPARARRLFWLACACAFVFLAVDELTQFHDRFGNWLSGANLARPETLPRWNEVVVTSYGAMALLFCALAMPEIRQHKSVAGHLALGLVFLAGYAVAGSVFGAGALKEFTEELCKVLANTCFAIAMLGGLLSVAAARHDPMAPESETAGAAYDIIEGATAGVAPPRR